MSFSEKLQNIKDLGSKLKSLTKAVVLGSFISEERIQKRLEICFSCEHIVPEEEDERKFKCGVCGCALKGRSAILNLAAYEETSDYGCKAPGGSKWKAGGV